MRWSKSNTSLKSTPARPDADASGAGLALAKGISPAPRARAVGMIFYGT